MNISAIGSKKHHKFMLEITEKSVSKETNTSTLNFKFSVSQTSNWATWYGFGNNIKYSININGTKYSGYIPEYNQRTPMTIKEGTLDVKHNNDGTKQISFSFGVEDKTSYTNACGNASKSGTMALTKIDRYAIITSANDFTDEGTPSFSFINPTNEALQAKLSIKGIDITSYVSIPTGQNLYSFQLTTAQRDIIRSNTVNRTKNDITYHLKSANYEDKMVKQVSIINANPTVGYTVKDRNATTVDLTGNDNQFIKYHSKANFQIDSIGKKFATIMLTGAEMGDGAYAEGNNVFINNVANDNFRVFAVDSRGLTTNNYGKLNMIDYMSVSVSMTASPNLEGGTSAVDLSINGTFFNSTFGKIKNNLQLFYRYHTEGGTYGGWQPIPFTAGSTNNFYVNHTVRGLDYRQTYTFQVMAKDALEEALTAERKVSIKPVFDWGKNDFNFNVPIGFNGVPMVDFVQEQDSDSNWIWRKWSSGFAECWGSFEVSGAIDLTYSGLYYGSKIDSQRYPITFVSKPREQVNLLSNGVPSTPDAFLGMDEGNTVTGTGIYYAMRPSKSASIQKRRYDFYIAGRWK